MKKVVAFCLAMLLLAGCTAVVDENSTSQSSSISQESISSSSSPDANESSAKKFSSAINDLFAENDLSLYSAAMAYDKSSFSTDVIISKNVTIWCFSANSDAPIDDISVVGTFPASDSDREYFAAEYGFAVGCSMVVCDSTLTLDEAVKVYADMMSSYSSSSTGTVKKSKNGFDYQLQIMGDELYFDITIPT